MMFDAVNFPFLQAGKRLFVRILPLLSSEDNTEAMVS